MSLPGKTALVLTGGGARAAYQVGVLQAMMLIRRAVSYTHLTLPTKA